MQDDNLEHMEYLLTEQSYENWLDGNSASVFEKLMKDEALSILDIYLKEHGLPVGSEIKE